MPKKCNIHQCSNNVFGGGYCKSHQYLRTPKEKIVSINHRGLFVREIEPIKPIKQENDTWTWFKERRAKMTGFCKHCGGKSLKDNDDMFHFSIAHILEKSHFPSIKTHPENWLELCHFGNFCHSNLDNKMLDLIDLNCFDEVITKFTAMYPSISQSERRRIPPILMEYYKNEI